MTSLDDQDSDVANSVSEIETLTEFIWIQVIDFCLTFY